MGPVLTCRRTPHSRGRLMRWTWSATRRLRQLSELCCCLLCLAALWQWQHSRAIPRRDTLVMYIFSATDPEYINNLRFFVSEAMRPGDRCHYVVVVQQATGKAGGTDTGHHHRVAVDEDLHHVHAGMPSGGGTEHSSSGVRDDTLDDALSSSSGGGTSSGSGGSGASDGAPDFPALPKLPQNAEYVYHHNECYDWGTYGWLLVLSGKVDARMYKYFVLLNSSVRGPFLPPHLRTVLHWTEPLISQLNEDVKLVGSTISCEGSPYQGNPADVWRTNPHVQSYVLATDRVGMGLMLRDAHVFACHNERYDAIFYSEIGSSWAVLNGGFNIGSLMIRYQNVDWRNESNWQCNGNKSPVGANYNDGQDIDPYEVMFVKLKSHHLAEPPPPVAKALRYQQWQQDAAARHFGEVDRGTAAAAEEIDDSAGPLSGNDFEDAAASDRLRRILVARERGSACFDFDAYQADNPALRLLLAQPQHDQTDEGAHSRAAAADPGSSVGGLPRKPLFPRFELDLEHLEQAHARTAGDRPAGRTTGAGVKDQVTGVGQGGAASGGAGSGALEQAAHAWLWRHWVLVGQFDEEWKGHFTCEADFVNYPAIALLGV